MQFISVNIVILKKGGAGVNGQAFMEVMVPVRSVYLCQDHDIQQDDSVRGIDHNHDEYETMTLTRTTTYSLFRVLQLQEKAERDSARLRPTVLQG